MLKKIIGICISTIHHEDRFAFIKALNRAAVARDYRLMVFNSCSDLYEMNNPDNNGELTVFQLIPYEKLSAMIIFPYFLFNHPIADEIVEKCKEYHVPVISVDKEIEGCTCFRFGYEDIFERIIHHVIEVHHAKTLRMITGAPGNNFAEERKHAFQHALESHGILYDDSLVGYGCFWEGPTEDIMMEWFEKEKQPYPDAIICANDTMAIAVSMYLQKHGCRVPEECIVTGFDGIVQAEYFMPHLTTARQDYFHMCEDIMDAIESRSEGGTYPAVNQVGFEMICSQSCGCEERSFDNINDAMQQIFDRLRMVTARQEMVCMLQSSISKMRTIAELPAILIEKFVFHTSVFAINDDLFQSPQFGAKHMGEYAFSDELKVLYHRYFWNQLEPCTTSRKEIIPDLDAMLAREDPIVICAMHYFDLTLGYCAFQTEITHDEYEKIYTFMNAINASFGAFHGRMQIQVINSQLTRVNEELEKLYIHDYLTGLYNRRGFYLEFRKQRERLGHQDLNAFVVSVDLDGLKYINDNFGHLEGDNAICTVAQALLKNVAVRDICARFGGDEFAVGGLLGAEQAEIWYRSFRNNFLAYLERYNAISQNPYPVEASIGFCSEPLDEDFDLDRLIRVADNRMYEDKQARKKARQ